MNFGQQLIPRAIKCLACHFEVTCHRFSNSTDIQIMPGNLYWEHNDFCCHGHALTNQIKATVNQMCVWSPENIPVDVTTDTEFSRQHVQLCLFAKFDPLPYTAYSVYKIVL